MPLTSKGQEIMSNMKKNYGSEKKAKQVFYASKNSGKIKGVDRAMSRDRKTIARFLDEAAASEEIGKMPPAPVSSEPSDAHEDTMYDALPTRDAFCKCVRDAVRAGLPLSKVLNMGATWGTGEGGHDKWQQQDKARSVVRDVGAESWVNGKRTGYKIGTATDAVRRFIDADRVAGALNLGEVSGRGQPMSGPDKGADKPDTDDKSRHFFKGSARDAVQRLVSRPSGLRARRAVPRRAI